MSAPKRLIPVLSAANFVIGMGAFVLIGMLTPVGQDFGIDPGRTGWLMTTYALAYAVLSPLLVSLTGSIGRRRVLAYALTGFAVANLLSALAPTELTLHLTRILAAAGAGLLTPVSASVAAGLSAPERRGKALAAVVFGLTLAQVLGVPAGSFIAYTFGWRAAFVVVALLAVPIVPLIWRIVPSGLAFQTVTLPELGRTLRDGRTMLAVAFTATYLASAYVVYTYLAPLLEQTMGYGRNGITAVLLVFGAAAVIGNLAGGAVADRIGSFRTLLGLAVGQAVVLPLFSLMPLPGPLLVVLIAGWSLLVWSMIAGQQMRIIALRPAAAPIVLALNAAAIYIGAAAGSAIGSAIIAMGGMRALGVGGSAVAVVATVHILWSERLNRKSA
ncbi:MFS transporter [Loktanella sp. M215]|uniref:MFS transporter n=1 Tax=Loktanella sp. M215 TaxID=2675431 RepID=UPI001F212C48|nr:MFS transporter [Loktanella sp. M215]